MRSEWDAADLGESLVERETLYCRHCCASLRVRRLADVLLLHYAESAETAAGLVAESAFRDLDVAEINGVGALHTVLARHPRLHYSEFHEDAAPGELVGGVRNEDVCRLTYGDASFDVVLTADTLEHVPDYHLALREIRRVLRPGGRHIFTVPAMPSRRETVARVRLDNGTAVFLAPPQYHGRGSGPLALAAPPRGDFLAYHDFGLNLADDVRAAGFRCEIHFYRESGVDSDAAFVFCAEAA
jgi:SAM-dependent methyltransferase